MSYKARVYNVFIASPSDVSEERLAVRAQLEEWNTFHSEERNMVLLPIGWETHAMSEVGINPQDAINQTLLYKCDLLVGILWSKIGHPTPREKSGTIDEIKTHCSMGKPAILFFSKKSLPYDADLNQVNEIKKFKEEYMDKCIYIEYSTIEEFKNKLYEQIACII